MEERKMKEEEECAECGGCESCSAYGACYPGYGGMHGWGHGRRHYLLRWILGLLILAFVFGAGVKLGEFKAFVEGNGYGYGYGRMMDRGYWGMPGYGMMQQWRGDIAPEQQYGYGMMR